MLACTFFGHRECYGLEEAAVLCAIRSVIQKGADTFYVGNQGQFDRLVCRCLSKLKKEYPHIQWMVVLAYLPTTGEDIEAFDTIYPEIEEGPPRFAIARRNRWMVAHADFCICYIKHTWGGAYQFASLAKRKGLRTINLADSNLI